MFLIQLNALYEFLETVFPCCFFPQLRFKWLKFPGQATTKINVAVAKLPQFHCCKLNSPDAGPQHMGTIHIGSERYSLNIVIQTCIWVTSMLLLLNVIKPLKSMKGAINPKEFYSM